MNKEIGMNQRIMDDAECTLSSKMNSMTRYHLAILSVLLVLAMGPMGLMGPTGPMRLYKSGSGWVHVLSRLGTYLVSVGCMSCLGWVHVLWRFGVCLVTVGCMSCRGWVHVLSRSDISRNSLIFPETAVYFQKQSYISRNSRFKPGTTGEQASGGSKSLKMTPFCYFKPWSSGEQASGGKRF